MNYFYQDFVDCLFRGGSFEDRAKLTEEWISVAGWFLGMINRLVRELEKPTQMTTANNRVILKLLSGLI